METIAAILVLIASLAFWVMVVGLIKPSWVKLSSRKQALQGILASFVLAIIATIMLPAQEQGNAAESTTAETASSPDPAEDNKAEAPPLPASAESATSEEDKAVDQSEGDKPTLTMDMTAAQFEERINTILADTDFGKVKKKGGPTEGAKDLYLQQYDQKGKNVAFMLETAGKKGKATSVIMMAGGSQENPMGAVADMLIAMAGTIGAVDPSLKKEERGDIMMKKLKLSEAKPDDGIDRETVVNGIKYSLTVSKVLGFWLTVTPADI